MSTVKSKKLQVGTDATSSNNFTIYQPSTPDGTLRIGVGNADSPTEVGRFTSAGYKPATAPAFHARLASNQSISGSTFTKANLTVEQFDTNNNFDNATNYRFTPTISGYYQINASIFFGGTSISRGIVSIWKNGAELTRTDDVINTQLSQSISILTYMNGTTDYIELYGYCVGSAPLMGSGFTHLSGYLVQQA